MISSGYLRVIENLEYGYARVDISNYEIRKLFERIIVEWFINVLCNRDLESLVDALVNLDYERFTREFKGLVLEMFSTWDVGQNISENFYHAFVLGLLVSLKNKYVIKSNKESGFGRYDILLKPVDKSNPSFIIEFKVVRDNTLKMQ